MNAGPPGEPSMGLGSAHFPGNLHDDVLDTDSTDISPPSLAVASLEQCTLLTYYSTDAGTPYSPLRPACCYIIIVPPASSTRAALPFSHKGLTPLSVELNLPLPTAEFTAGTRSIMNASSFSVLLLSIVTSAAAFTSLPDAFGNSHSSAQWKHTTVLQSSVGGPSEELLDLFNAQVTNEFSASQAYLSASIWFNSHDWEGMAAYMLAESAEERGHGLALIDFANKRNIPIKLQNVAAPNSEWESPEDVWQDILELEQSNTKSILELAEEASKCNDFAILAFLNPFHMEQVDAEDTIGNILAKVKDENRTPGLLRQLDHELREEAGAA